MERIIESILNFWSYSWYLSPIVMISAIYSLIKVYQSGLKSLLSSATKWYLASVFLLFAVTDFLFLSASPGITPEKYVIVEMTNNAFNMVEGFVFLLFLTADVSEKMKVKMKSLMMLNATVTITAFLVLLNDLSINEAYRRGAMWTLIHFLLILSGCVMYFYDIYKENAALDMTKVFIVFVITTYSVISIPVFAIVERSYVYEIFGNTLMAIHYILLSILCISLWRAISESEKKIIKRRRI